MTTKNLKENMATLTELATHLAICLVLIVPVVVMVMAGAVALAMEWTVRRVMSLQLKLEAWLDKKLATTGM